MKDRIEPYDEKPSSYESIFGRGDYLPLKGKTFSDWTGYLSKVVDNKGLRGTIIYIPNVGKDELFTNG